MCGIVAYIGKRQAVPVILKGLYRLEYRGYDSAGIALIDEKGELEVYKSVGKVSGLEEMMNRSEPMGTIGIGHTRWATHGEPNNLNAHPQFSQSGNIAMVHNGIIENYNTIKKALKKRGHEFTSETDTEVLVHLVEEIYTSENIPLEEAVRQALKVVEGAYAIVFLSKTEPNKLIAARKGSPLVIGVGKDEFLFASDASPIVESTNKVVYLNDGEIAIIDNNELVIKTIDNVVKPAHVQELEVKLEMIEKGGFDHFMLKEIYEQPRSIYDSMRGRVDSRKGHIHLGGLSDYRRSLLNARRIIIVACGTSWHAGLVGEYLIEDSARIPVEVEYASEFRYRDPIIYEDDVVIAISQSGETADTLAAIELAKSKGATILGICNVVGSSIPRATDAGCYTHAGPEIGVASTKAFTAQVTVLTIIAKWIAHLKGKMTKSSLVNFLSELEQVPSKIEQVLELNDQIKEIAGKFMHSKNFLYLGRGYSFPVALEGALKLKEISYIHAEGYPAAEMKHGPIALIDENMPVVVIATKSSQYEKVVSNVQEVKARKGIIIAIVSKGDVEVRKLADYIIEIPQAHEQLKPLISTVPLQLLSYHIAVMRGCDVDMPRNLAKSVTVE